jgi:hypothetical protein
VELNVFRVLIIRRGKLVEFAAELINLCFVYADSTQDEVFFIRISRRPCVVEI